jgi:lipopolysaccharide/colanic/teichoic acid biosynthesis glycosyltransferase
MSHRHTVLPPSLRASRVKQRARVRRALFALRLALVSVGPLARRAIDVVAVGLGLVLVAPILALAALAIRWESPGPVLFAQERLGQHGRRFRLYKLRTMFHGADAQKTALAAARRDATDGVRFKLRRDPRVTRVGRVLRKLSIDELPQLWNVLIGDMTLVGPRPPVRREVDLYDTRALRRLEVRPGLTCLWQVGGRSDLSFEQQVELDLRYIDLVSASEEVAIVARTIPAVLTGRGAY